MTPPWLWWSAERIAAASDCPVENVREHWPGMLAQLDACVISTPNVGIGVIGTTAIEGASTFAPVKEGCYLGELEPAQSHRETLSYAPYWGRGHVQLTHAGNYARYGQKVAELWGADPSSLDLLASPDHALDSDVAAAVIATYFRDTRALPSTSYPEGYSLVQACEDRDWEWVRRLVYGGADPAGAARIERIAAELGPPGGELVGTLPVYDSACPAISQNDAWSCAPTSMRWALTAYGRNPSEAWLEGSMLSEGVVSTNLGLLNASGIELARWADRHYSEFGYDASHDELVSFQDVAEEAAELAHPLLLGGRGWNHWSGVRGFDGTRLKLANPASGWKGVTQTMTREQFAHLGTFSLVRLTHPEAEAEDPVPPIDPADPYAPWRGQVGSGLIDMMAADATMPGQHASTWLPLGVNPADVEECYGRNGTLYIWLLTVGAGFRIRPT